MVPESLKVVLTALLAITLGMVLFGLFNDAVAIHQGRMNLP